jgi:enamine deaminase RidA (YjgF/YER057c/UK114 family)
MKPAVIHQNTVYVSGQLPIAADEHPLTDSFAEQPHLCLQNLETVLLDAGSDLQPTLNVSVFFSDICNWPN